MESSANTGFDMTEVYVHLGLGARAEALPDFTWGEVKQYEIEHAADGDEGRLVSICRYEETWTIWERHPVGDEVVLALSGHQTLIQEIDGEQRRIELRAGQAAINPRGTWHTADVHEVGSTLFITPGRGTEHRPR